MKIPVPVVMPTSDAVIMNKLIFPACFTILLFYHYEVIMIGCGANLHIKKRTWFCAFFGSCLPWVPFCECRVDC